MNFPFKSQNSSLVTKLLVLSLLSFSLMPSTLVFAQKAKVAVKPSATNTIIKMSEVKNVELKNDTVIYQFDSEEKVLKKHGEGIRKKKVAVINVDVYHISLYTYEDLLAETNAFKILESDHLAMVMKPLRSFGGDKLKEALIESYKVNSVDENKEAHQTFMNLIGGEKVNKGEEIILLGQNAGTTDILYVKRGEQFEIIKGHDGFVNEVFAVWLGKTVDKQLESVKSLLLGIK